MELNISTAEDAAIAECFLIIFSLRSLRTQQSKNQLLTYRVQNAVTHLDERCVKALRGIYIFFHCQLPELAADFWGRINTATNNGARLINEIAIEKTLPYRVKNVVVERSGIS